MILQEALENTSHWWLPPNVSEHGHEVDRMWWIITILVGVTFVAVEALIVWFCFKYRKQDDGRRALYTHGSHRLEVAWTIIPTVILVALGLFSNDLWGRIKSHRPPDSEIGARVRVLAQRFTWNVYYPGADQKLETEDDVLLDRKVVLPLDEMVLIRLGSKDVIHSFFIPLARVKQDAVPGYWGSVWFRIEQPSDPGPDGIYVTDDDKPFEVACAELCGDSHYDMYGMVYVLPRPQYDEWIRNLK